MKKIILSIALIGLGISFSFGEFSDFQKTQMDKVGTEISNRIYSNGMEYKNNVMKLLTNFKTNLSGDSRVQIIDYIIEKLQPVNVKYAIAIYPTPVMNTSDIESVFFGTGYGPKLDSDNQIAELETIAFSGTVFTIKGEIISGNNKVYIADTSEYPYPATPGYYIDSRFVQITDKKPQERKIILPTKEETIINLKSYTGFGYVRGGNILSGVSVIEQFYKPLANIDNTAHDKLILSGFDCSGILYYATNGYTPRNTSKLIKFGTGLTISGSNIDQIVSLLQPLDIIGWKGHIMIVIDKENLIESRLDYDTSMTGNQEPGVKIRNIKSVLADVMKDRTAVNNYDDILPEGKKKFVIRRRLTY